MQQSPTDNLGNTSQQPYKPASRGLSAIAELLVVFVINQSINLFVSGEPIEQ